jgi:hypothetical protein
MLLLRGKKSAAYRAVGGLAGRRFLLVDTVFAI